MTERNKVFTTTGEEKLVTVQLSDIIGPAHSSPLAIGNFFLSSASAAASTGCIYTQA